VLKEPVAWSGLFFDTLPGSRGRPAYGAPLSASLAPVLLPRGNRRCGSGVERSLWLFVASGNDECANQQDY
jgi:hypothetical protein